MIALLENEFVEKKKWITKNEFIDMVAIAESAVKIGFTAKKTRIC